MMSISIFTYLQYYEVSVCGDIPRINVSLSTDVFSIQNHVGGKKTCV